MTAQSKCCFSRFSICFHENTFLNLIHMFTNYQRVEHHKFVFFCLLPGSLDHKELQCSQIASKKNEKIFEIIKRRQSETLWAFFSCLPEQEPRNFSLRFIVLLIVETWKSSENCYAILTLNAPMKWKRIEEKGNAGIYVTAFFMVSSENYFTTFERFVNAISIERR